MALEAWLVDDSNDFPGGTESHNKGVAGRNFDHVGEGYVYKMKDGGVLAFYNSENAQYHSLMTAAGYNSRIKLYNDHVQAMLKEAIRASKAELAVEIKEAVSAARAEMDVHLKDALGAELGGLKAQIAQTLVDLRREQRERNAAIADLDARRAGMIEVSAAFHKPLRAHHAEINPGSAQCLRPGRGTPSWSGSADEWCSTACTNMPPEQNSQCFRQAFQHRPLAAKLTKDEALMKVEQLDALVAEGTPGVDAAPASEIYERLKEETVRRKEAHGKAVAMDAALLVTTPDQNLHAKFKALDACRRWMRLSELATLVAKTQ